MDVVEAKREDWDFDPFKLQEVDGYFRGRGAIDDKAMASIFVANMISSSRKVFRPERDIILALTADEELSDCPMTACIGCWRTTAISSTPSLINEGGTAMLKDGKPFLNTVQLAERSTRPTGWR